MATENPGEVKAAIFYKENNRWTLTSNKINIIDAEPEDLIFVDTIEELKLELESRHPADEDYMSFVTETGYSNQVTILEEPIAKTQDLELLKAAAKKYGTIQMENYLDHNLREEGFITDGYRLTYDPELAKKELTNQKRQKRKRERQAAKYAKLLKEKAMVPIGLLQEYAQWLLYEVSSTTINRFVNNWRGVSSEHCFSYQHRCDRLMNAVPLLIEIVKKIKGRTQHRTFPRYKEFLKGCASDLNKLKGLDKSPKKEFIKWLRKEYKTVFRKSMILKKYKPKK